MICLTTGTLHPLVLQKVPVRGQDGQIYLPLLFCFLDYISPQMMLMEAGPLPPNFVKVLLVTVILGSLGWDGVISTSALRWQFYVGQ